MRLLLGSCLMVILLTSCLADLRPKNLRSEADYTEEMHVKGVEVLDKYARVSGQEKWDQVISYQVYFNDDFYGLTGKYAHPFGQKKNQFKLAYYAQENAGSLLFLNGKNKGKTWGYNEGNCFIRETPNGPPLDVEKKGIKFWLPTYQYFLEFPFRIKTADVIYHVGEEKYGLHTYDKVLVSWRSAAPQKKLDQYLLWVNQSNGLVDKLQYTIRDQGAILKGTAFIEEHTVYEGIIIPSFFKVYLRENARKPLHIMRPHNFKVTARM